MTKPSDLPDYPAIKKLAAALWQREAHQHGTAIMIGAGFSRSAARHVSGEKKIPLWNEFSANLATELNPGLTELNFSDPLRVAEEYRAYFGQAALNDQIRFQIDDDAWRHGDLYQSLLKLPWSEVMTTNWDTLLERAAKDIHSPYYTVVTKPTDLAWAPSPRIVKLHGTIGVTDRFIAAQEDYRTYPEKFAPFVNFARQVFIENELCLLGFSGDDPNFLQWAGWVRDHLADHARKIYLVGALNLSAARRKHLESISIVPIDMWEAVKHIDGQDLRHQMATKLFLQAIEDEGKANIKPHEWTPSNLHRSQASEADRTRTFKEPEYAAVLLKAQLKTLQKDRETYPGWLVCPPALLWQLQSQLNDPFPNPKNIAALGADDAPRLLYEIAWRHSVTFESITPWLAEELFKVADPDKPCSISKRQQLEIALVLLGNTRWLDASDELGKQAIRGNADTLISTLEKHAQYLPDCSAELAYHKALVARDTLDYSAMEIAAENITGEDSVWKLRKAALLTELGRFDEGEELIAKAYGEARENHRRNRYSVHALSRLVWSHWLLNATQQYKFNQSPEILPDFAESKYRQWKCDPWVWIEHIRDKTIERQEKYLKSQTSIEPLFEAGHYRDNSNNRSFSRHVSELLLLNGLTKIVGIPLRSGNAFLNVNLLAGSAEKLALATTVGEELRDYALAIRAAHSETSPSIKEVFTRIGVARTSQAVVDALVSSLIAAIYYWRNKRGSGSSNQQAYALSALRVLMEVLARLSVRVSSERAKEIFRLGLAIGQQRNLQNYWLSEVLNHLLTYSLKSTPASEQGELLPDALGFPLPNEALNDDFREWPNPVIKNPSSRESYDAIAKRIGELIDAASPNGSTSCTAALLRLLPLVEKGFLSQDERSRLAQKIWGAKPNYHSLPNTGLFPFTLLLLPAPDTEKTKTFLLSYLYDQNENLLADTQRELSSYPSPVIQRAISIYGGMANAASNLATHLFPTPEQALILFDQLIVWRPKEETDDFFSMVTTNQKQLAESISAALADAITPALPDELKTAERFEQLFAFYEQVDGATSLLTALVFFTHLNRENALRVETTIRKALQHRQADTVAYAAIALLKWTELINSAENISVTRLISKMIVIIESGRTVGLQHLLWTTGEIFKKNWLSDEQVTTLAEAIPNIFDSVDYKNIEPNSQEAISAPLIRKACVELAKVLATDVNYANYPELQNLLQQAQTDALPEVRFAAIPSKT